MTIADIPLVRARPLQALLLSTLFLVGADTVAAQTSPLRLSGQVGFRVEYMANENFAENDATRDDDRRLRFRARVRVGGAYDVSEAVTWASA